MHFKEVYESSIWSEATGEGRKVTDLEWWSKETKELIIENKKEVYKVLQNRPKDIKEEYGGAN